MVLSELRRLFLKSHIAELQPSDAGYPTSARWYFAASPDSVAV